MNVCSTAAHTHSRDANRRARDLVTLVTDGSYFDSSTLSAQFLMVTSNRQLKSELLTLTSLDAGTVEGGGIEVNYGIQVINTLPYGSPTDQFRFSLEILLLCALAGQIAFELRDLHSQAVAHLPSYRALYFGVGVPRYWPGTPVHCVNLVCSVCCSYLSAPLLKYSASVADLLDIVNYLITAATIAYWYTYWRATVALKQLELQYDVYEGGDAWFERSARVLEYTDGISDLQEAYEKLFKLGSLVLQYKLFVLANIIVIILQLLKRFDFHPSMGIITRTISKSGYALVFWFCLQGVGPAREYTSGF